MPDSHTDDLTILLLGPPRILLNGQPLTFPSIKAVALLGYIAVSGRLHNRAELALLLWPDSDHKRARGALRYTLSLLRKELGTEFLIINRHHIGLKPEANWEADVVTMRRQLAPALQTDNDLTSDQIADLVQGLGLYQADFLHGFTLRDSDNFNEWAIGQAEVLRRELAAALKRMTDYYDEQQNWDAALSYGHRWLNLDPLHEAAHCRLMQIYASTGQWAAVHHQYQALVDLLDRDVGAPPQPETEAMYRRLCRQEETARAKLLPLTTLSRDQRSQRVLIEKVRRFWIHGLLVPLRREETFIRLGLQFTSEAIDHPWADVLDEHPPPTATSIREAFQAADQALLILGAAGAGKTIMLVDLADNLLDRASADNTQPIPVILTLNTWAGREMTIAEWAVEEMVSQYQIPRRLGRAWLAQDRLLLLLDGLDEMPEICRRDCIKAINTFRQTHGLTDVVVCCRQEAYQVAVRESSPRLHLNGAVVIHPLTPAQIRKNLSSPLAETIFQDEALLEMARSPLILNIIRLTFNNNGTGHRETTAPLTHHQLFRHYVQRMFQRQADKGVEIYSSTKTTNNLNWLARQMAQHQQAIFLIEQLQPSWLPRGGWQWLYLFLTRSVLAALLGTPIGWSFIKLIEINPPVIEVHFLERVAAWVGLTLAPWNALFSLFILVLVTGFFAGLVDGLFFTWRQERGDESGLYKKLGWLQLLAVGGTVWITATGLLITTDAWPLALALGGMEALCFILAFGYLRYGQSFRTEIRSQEALAWAWRRALILGLVGAICSVIWSGFAWLQDPASPRWFTNLLNTGLAFFLLGGVSGKRVEPRSRPNEGIRIAGQNGLKVTLLLSVVPALLTAITVDLPSGLLTGLLFGLLAGVVHGLNDVSKHITLRLLLWVERRIPLNYAHLLDYAAHCVLLQKVGGGYTFRHRLLLEYFAKTDAFR